MKKMIFTIAAIGLMMTGVAQNEEPNNNGTHPEPDTLQQKANYNTTRTSKTIKAPEEKLKKEKKKNSEVKKSGGGQSFNTPFILLQNKKRIQREKK